MTTVSRDRIRRRWRGDLDFAARAGRIGGWRFAGGDYDLALRNATGKQVIGDVACPLLCEVEVLEQGAPLICEADDQHPPVEA